jgi:hypothetical protein
MMKMTTFSMWLKRQGNREDAIGYISRYWEAATPGRISSVTGIKRHLEQLSKDHNEGDDEQAKVAIAAALSGFGLAVKEYHQVSSIEIAKANGALPPDFPMPGAPGAQEFRAGSLIPDAEPTDVIPLPQQKTPGPRTAPAAEGGTFPPGGDNDPAPAPAGRYTGWPQERFDRLEERLARIEARIAALADGQAAAAADAPVDWPALFSLSGFPDREEIPG